MAMWGVDFPTEKRVNVYNLRRKFAGQMSAGAGGWHGWCGVKDEKAGENEVRESGCQIV